MSAEDEFERLRRGDREACVTFVDKHYHRVFAWFTWLTRDWDRSADLTQDTFAAFWDSLRRRRVRSPKIWLYKIARNRWRKYCHAASRRNQPILEDDVVDASQDPRECATAAELVQIVSTLLSHLPVPYRESVTLRYWHDLSYKEIGAIQGVPASLARWRAHRGRALMRNLLRNKELTGAECHD